MAHNGSLTTSHNLTSWLDASLWGALRGSRFRDGQFDFTMPSTGLNLSVYPSPKFDITLSGSVSRLLYPPAHDLSYFEPNAGLGIIFRPIEKLSLSANVNRAWRTYDGRAFVRGEILVPGNYIFDDRAGNWIDGMPDPSNPGQFIPETPPNENNDLPLVDAPLPQPTFCYPEDLENAPLLTCTPRDPRKDTENSVLIGVRYRGEVLLSAAYSLRIQRSNSDYENIDRHRFTASATFGLPLEMYGTVLGAIQFNDGASVTETLLFAEDDQNQNSLQAQLSRALTDELTIDLRYALFAYRFTTVDERFLRQTIYLGLSYETGT